MNERLSDNASRPITPQAPAASAILSEARTVFDVGSMLVRLAQQSLQKTASQKNAHVVMLPGFGSDDRYMVPLGAHLKKLGYANEGWGLGINLAGANLDAKLTDLSDRWQFEAREEENGEAGVPYLCDLAIDRIKQRADELQRPLALIGWSLGGYIAREVARELADEVTCVVTMGAPVVGGPKYTRAASVFERRGLDLDWIEEQIRRRDETPIRQPITAIFSKSDGIVGWQAAIDQQNPNVKHVEVNVPHLGMGFNQQVWRLVADALAANEQTLDG